MRRRSFTGPANQKLAGGFAAAAATLSLGCSGVAVGSLVQGKLEQALLMAAVGVFAAWMAMAIRQFQQRIAAIDEVVRQARSRVEQADQTLIEMRQLAERLRGAAAADDPEEDRTLH